MDEKIYCSLETRIPYTSALQDPIHECYNNWPENVNVLYLKQEIAFKDQLEAFEPKSGSNNSFNTI